MRLCLLTGISAAWLLLSLLAPSRADEPPRIEFNRDVRPILSENCYSCHGPDKSHRKAQLRLDERESALKHAAVVPGKPDESELVFRILSTDDDVMPPAEIPAGPSPPPGSRRPASHGRGGPRVRGRRRSQGL